MGNECEGENTNKILKKNKNILFSPSFLVHYNPVEPLGLVCAVFPYLLGWVRETNIEYTS